MKLHILKTFLPNKTNETTLKYFNFILTSFYLEMSRKISIFNCLCNIYPDLSKKRPQILILTSLENSASEICKYNTRHSRITSKLIAIGNKKKIANLSQGKISRS